MRTSAWRTLCGAVISCGVTLASATAAIKVQDDAGQTVQLTAPAQRVVSLAPFLTELVFATGGGERLLGVSEFSDFPPAANRIRRVASAAGVDYEGILMLRPDLVLVWRSGNGPAVIRRLEQLGLTVYASEPRRPQDVARNLRNLARLLGTETTSEQVARKFETQIHRLRQRYARRAPVDVFFQISHRPLMTLNGDHIVSAALRVCGGRNVFSGARPLTPTVDREAVVRQDPQVILIDASMQQAESVRQAWLEAQATAAARRGHVYTVDPDLVTRPTPRFVRGVELLCTHIDRAR